MRLGRLAVVIDRDVKMQVIQIPTVAGQPAQVAADPLGNGQRSQKQVPLTVR